MKVRLSKPCAAVVPFALVLALGCAAMPKPSDMETYEQEYAEESNESVRKRYPDLVEKAVHHHALAEEARDDKEEELARHHARVALQWWRAATLRSRADDMVAERKQVTEELARTQQRLADARKQVELAESVIALRGKVADSQGGNVAREAVNAALIALKDAQRVEAEVHAPAKFKEAESKLEAATEALNSGKTSVAQALAREAETAAASARAEAQPKYAASKADRQRSASQRELFESLSGVNGVSAAIVEGGVRVTVVESFERNGVEIKPIMEAVYARIADVAKQHSELSLVIEGHTDSSGSKSQNLQLSDARAKSVSAFLAKKGVEPGRMSALGKGPEEPVASNRTRQGRAKNRRIEILFATPGV